MVCRETLKAELLQYGSRSIDLASDLAAVHDSRLYRQWGFTRFGAWVEADSNGHVSKAQAYRMVMVYRTFKSVWTAVRQGVESGTVGMQLLTGMAGMVERGQLGRDEAIEHLKQGTAPGDYKSPEYRHLRAIPRELRVLFEQAANVARFNLNMEDPGFEHIIEWMIALTRDQAEDQTHTTSDGMTVVFTADDMMEGKIRCKECGNWDWTQLDPHHVIPRSQSQHQTQNELVLLCRSCHQIWQPRWKEFARKHGYGHLLPKESTNHLGILTTSHTECSPCQSSGKPCESGG